MSRKVLFAATLGWLGVPVALFSADCNGNGTDDDADIRMGISLDCNRNGRPDECDLSRTASLFPQTLAAPRNPTEVIIPVNCDDHCQWDGKMVSPFGGGLNWKQDQLTIGYQGPQIVAISRNGMSFNPGQAN